MCLNEDNINYIRIPVDSQDNIGFIHQYNQFIRQQQQAQPLYSDIFDVLDFKLQFLFMHYNLITMQDKIRTILGPVLAIKASDEATLSLEWNLTGITVPTTQYYHFFLSIGNSNQSFSQFLQAYYSKLRFGELIGIYFPRDLISFKKSSFVWEEKTEYLSYKMLVRQNKFHVDQLKSEILQQIMNIFIKIRGMIVLNIFCDYSPQISEQTKSVQDKVKCFVAKLRQKNKEADKIYFNLISSYYSESKIDSCLGLALIAIQNSDYIGCCYIILEIVKLIIVRSMKVMIKTKTNFNIISSNCSQWKVSDVSEMWKQYYALPKLNFIQIISFQQLNNSKQAQLQLIVHLNFNFYDDSEIIDKKIISMNRKTGKCCHKTQNNQNQKQFVSYELIKHIFVSTNLLRKQTTILLASLESD